MPAERRILLDRRAGRRIAALLVGGRLRDLLVETRATPAPGEIWAARVDKPASRAAGGGAFLDLGAARAFLPGGEGLAPGDAVKIEIRRAAEDEKAATASLRLDFAGPRLAHTPDAPGVNVSKKIADAAERARLKEALAEFAAAGGFVLRTAARGVAAETLREEAAALVAEAEAIAAEPARPPRRLRAAPGLAVQAARLWPDAPCVEDDAAPIDARPLARFGVEEALRELLSPRVALAGPGLSGAWIACERTAAVVAIDVNAGGARSIAAANRAALAEIPRQLRLRGWGGQIVVDLAGGAPRDAAARDALVAALRSAADAPLEALGFGPLGLLEARRKRDRAPIETLLSAAELDAQDAPGNAWEGDAT